LPVKLLFLLGGCEASVFPLRLKAGLSPKLSALVERVVRGFLVESACWFSSSDRLNDCLRGFEESKVGLLLRVGFSKPSALLPPGFELLYFFI
jgi:hypothetical protein